VRSEDFMSMKNSNDTSWDRTSDLPIVAQHLNHCATALLILLNILELRWQKTELIKVV